MSAAASVLGIRELAFPEYRDQQLDRADPREAVARIVGQIRRLRPDVVVTYGPDGAYGHPDHIAVSQFATAAVAAAADATFSGGNGMDCTAPAHMVKKLTTLVDARDHWPTVWRAVSCHESQVAAYEQTIGSISGVCARGST